MACLSIGEALLFFHLFSAIEMQARKMSSDNAIRNECCFSLSQASCLHPHRRSIACECFFSLSFQDDVALKIRDENDAFIRTDGVPLDNFSSVLSFGLFWYRKRSPVRLVLQRLTTPLAYVP
jgi:hypothetical protein